MCFFSLPLNWLSFLLEICFPLFFLYYFFSTFFCALVCSSYLLFNDKKFIIIFFNKRLANLYDGNRKHFLMELNILATDITSSFLFSFLSFFFLNETMKWKKKKETFSLYFTLYRYTHIHISVKALSIHFSFI